MWFYPLNMPVLRFNREQFIWILGFSDTAEITKSWEERAFSDSILVIDCHIIFNQDNWEFNTRLGLCITDIPRKLQTDNGAFVAEINGRGYNFKLQLSLLQNSSKYVPPPLMGGGWGEGEACNMGISWLLPPISRGREFNGTFARSSTEWEMETGEWGVTTWSEPTSMERWTEMTLRHELQNWVVLRGTHQL